MTEPDLSQIKACIDYAPSSCYEACCTAVAERQDNHDEGLRLHAMGRPEVLQAAAQTRRLWKPGRTITIRLIGGGNPARKTFERAVNAWGEHVNLTFAAASRHGTADIRVTFDPRSGAWSTIGTDALVVPQNQATMNLGWDDYPTALHEIGHALGLIHEHQHPDAGIPWDVQKVLNYYAGAPNFWSPAQTKANVLDKYDRRTLTNGAFDPASIMLYPVPAELLLPSGRDRATGWNRELSPGDIAFARRIYPPSTDLKGQLDRLLS